MKLIDKDILLTEIGRIKEMYCYDTKTNSSFVAEAVINSINNAINSIEVKELDLDKELSYEDYIRFFEEHPNFPNDWGFDEAWFFAKYFFKLGLKAQKGK